MEQAQKILLAEQANKIDKLINVLRTQFGNAFEDEINYLEIVKGNLSNTQSK